MMGDAEWGVAGEEQVLYLLSGLLAATAKISRKFLQILFYSLFTSGKSCRCMYICYIPALREILNINIFFLSFRRRDFFLQEILFFFF